MATTDAPRPLAGIRVIEFSHMVMGPTAGLILGDLGADVIKVEPLGEGDNTRRLAGAGAGFFVAFNRTSARSSRSEDPPGIAFIKRLIGSADVMIENFRPGALDAMGLARGRCGRLTRSSSIAH